MTSWPRGAPRTAADLLSQLEQYPRVPVCNPKAGDCLLGSAAARATVKRRVNVPLGTSRRYQALEVANQRAVSQFANHSSSVRGVATGTTTGSGGYVVQASRNTRLVVLWSFAGVTTRQTRSLLKYNITPRRRRRRRGVVTYPADPSRPDALLSCIMDCRVVDGSISSTTPDSSSRTVLAASPRDTTGGNGSTHRKEPLTVRCVTRVQRKDSDMPARPQYLLRPQAEETARSVG